MPHTYSNIEYADIVFCYGLCNGNASAARRHYALRYPRRRVPDRSVFTRTYQQLRETGTCQPLPRANAIPVLERNRRRADAILGYFDARPSASIRDCAAFMRVSRTAIWRTLNADRRHAYHLQRVHHIQPGDAEQRRRFCQWYIQQVEINPRFPELVLWTDEAMFTRNGIVNVRNSHIWAHANPRAMRVHHYQYEFRCNVWLGILGDTFIGPFFLPQQLNGERYRHFLTYSLPDLLDDVPLLTRRDMWLQMDGCPAHYAAATRNWLDMNYRLRWIGRGGPVAWPPRSPDLTPLDFFAWGAIKSQVYATPVHSVAELEDRIRQACTSIMRQQIRSAILSCQRRYRTCIREQGMHIEQLL